MVECPNNYKAMHQMSIPKTPKTKMENKQKWIILLAKHLNITIPYQLVLQCKITTNLSLLVSLFHPKCHSLSLTLCQSCQWLFCMSFRIHPQFQIEWDHSKWFETETKCHFEKISSWKLCILMFYLFTHIHQQ